MPTIDPSEISMYLPVRDAARTLQAAVRSAAQQCIRPAEIFLVVDLRSTDGSVELARRTGLRIVEQTEGRLGHARNLALSACRTRWLACADADVTVEPTWLLRLIERVDGHLAAVGGCTYERLSTPADCWRAVHMPHNWGPLPLENPFMLVSEMLADTVALRSVGGYRPDLQTWEDSDLSQRLRQAGYDLAYEPAAIAFHDRHDTVQSVLDLRWRYAWYRQRHRLENLAGLSAKLAVNRGYALASLSQVLHSEHPQVCAISIVLWFHHARADLDAALSLWPLLDEADRAACRAALDAALYGALHGRWALLAPAIDRLLSKSAPHSDPPGRGLSSLPGFRQYVGAVQEATRELLDNLPPAIVEAVLQSASYLAACEENGASARPATAFRRPELIPGPEDHQSLASLPRQPAWRWSELRPMLCRVLGRETVVSPRVFGPAEAQECPAQIGADGQPASLVLLPHLECCAEPAEAVRQASQQAPAVVIAYQAPPVFIPAVRVLSARDVAILCAQAGLKIRHFHTEAGLTLIVAACNGGTAQA